MLLLTTIVIALASGNNAETATASPRYQHLVLEGGGVRAISYAGALQALARRNYFVDGAYTFRRIGGTSAGCLVGLLVALDIEPSRLEQFAYSANLFASSVEFDPELVTTSAPYPADDSAPWYSLLRRSFALLARASELLGLWLDHDSPGLSGGRRFVELLRSELLPMSRHAAALGDIGTLTFERLRQVTGHQLTCYATRLSDQTLVELGTETTPQMSVLRALYASMAIPGLFKPLSDGNGGALVDGGLLFNFPITMNDDAVDGTIDAGTLGLSLAAEPNCLPLRQRPEGTTVDVDIEEQPNTDESDADLPLHRYDSLSEYLRDLYTTIVVTRQERIRYADCVANRNRVIYLESPLDTLHRRVTPELVTLAVDRAFRNTLEALDRTNDVVNDDAVAEEPPADGVNQYN
jgi:predicted acylesterase/phospholipase RssA